MIITKNCSAGGFTWRARFDLSDPKQLSNYKERFGNEIIDDYPPEEVARIKRTIKKPDIVFKIYVPGYKGLIHFRQEESSLDGDRLRTVRLSYWPHEITSSWDKRTCFWFEKRKWVKDSCRSYDWWQSPVANGDDWTPHKSDVYYPKMVEWIK